MKVDFALFFRQSTADSAPYSGAMLCKRGFLLIRLVDIIFYEPLFQQSLFWGVFWEMTNASVFIATLAKLWIHSASVSDDVRMFSPRFLRGGGSRLLRLILCFSLMSGRSAHSSCFSCGTLRAQCRSTCTCVASVWLL